MEQESIFVGEQKLTQDEKQLVEEAYQNLETWRRGCQEYHDRVRESRNIYRLRDPKQDLPGTKYEERTLQLQTLKSTVNNCVADQMDNMPEPIMVPETPGLEQTAEDLTDVVRFILNRNDYEALHRRRVEDFFIAGTSVTQIAWDETMENGEGDVALIRWPIEAFLWDPLSDTLQGSRAVMKVAWYPLSWFKAHYPDQAPYIKGDGGSYSDVGKHEAQEANNEGEARAMLMEYWYRTFDADKNKYSVHVAYLAGGALLEHHDHVYNHGLYPFVLDVFTPIEGLPVGDSLVQELADMMRYVNRYAHYVDENLRMAAKNRALVRRNANLDMKALCNWQANVIEGDDISSDAVQWFQSKPLSGMAPQQMMQFQTDIKQDSGQNQFTRGETAGGVTAASAISALQEAGGKITRLRTAVLNQGFKLIVEQVMWLVSQFYGSNRTLMITGRQGQPREVDISAEHLMGMDAKAQTQGDEPAKTSRKKREAKALPAPPYHVQIQISRRNPLRVQAQNELYIQAYSMAAQGGQNFPLSMLFELLQVDGKDRIMPVLHQLDQQNQMLQQAQQAMAENEQLKAQVGNMQKVLSSQGESLRGGMYPQAQQTDQALPDVGAV